MSDHNAQHNKSSPAQERELESEAANPNRFKMTFDWRATALALLLLPLLLSLGFWQLERAEEKTRVKALFQQRQIAGPVAIQDLIGKSDLQFQPVSLNGNFVSEKVLFLDNRIYRGQFGYEVVVPFKLADSELLVLVNRGWVAGDSSRRTLPDLERIGNNEVTLEVFGEIYVPQSEMFRLADELHSTSWPRVSQSISVSSYSEEFSEPMFPYEVRLQQSSPGGLQANWMIVNIEPKKHIGYAVQWFSMSFVLLIIVLVANTNFVSYIKNFFSKK